MNVSPKDVLVILDFWDEITEENATQMYQNKIVPKLSNSLLRAVLKTNPNKLTLSDILTNAVIHHLKETTKWVSEQESSLSEKKEGASSSEANLTLRRRNRFLNEMYQKVTECMDFSSTFLKKCVEAPGPQKENILLHCDRLVTQMKEHLKISGNKGKDSEFSGKLLEYYKKTGRPELLSDFFKTRAEKEGTLEAISDYFDFLKGRTGPNLSNEQKEEGEEDEEELGEDDDDNILQEVDSDTEEEREGEVKEKKSQEEEKESVKKEEVPPLPSIDYEWFIKLLFKRLGELERQMKPNEHLEKRIRNLESHQIKILQQISDVKKPPKQPQPQPPVDLKGYVKLTEMKKIIQDMERKMKRMKKETSNLAKKYATETEKKLKSMTSAKSKSKPKPKPPLDDDDDENILQEVESDDDVIPGLSNQSGEESEEIIDEKENEMKTYPPAPKRRGEEDLVPAIKVNNLGRLSGDQIREFFAKEIGPFSDFQYHDLLREATIKLKNLRDVEKAYNVDKIYGERVSVSAVDGNLGIDLKEESLFEKVSPLRKKKLEKKKTKKKKASSPHPSYDPNDFVGEIVRDEKTGKVYHPKQIKVTIIDRASITGKRVHQYFAQAGVIEKFDEIEPEEVYIITYEDTKSVENAFSPILRDESVFRIEKVVQHDRRKHLVDDCDEFCNEVFIGWVPDTISEEELGRFVGDCGEIESISLKQSRNVKKKKYAFVKFRDHQAVKKAFVEKNGMLFRDELMMVDVWKRDEIRLQPTVRVDAADFPPNFPNNQIEREVIDYFRHFCKSSEIGDVEGVKYEKQKERLFLSFYNIRTMRLVIKKYDGKRIRLFKGKRNKMVTLDFYPLPSKDEGVKLAHSEDYSVMVMGAEGSGWVKSVKRFSEVKEIFRKCGLILDIRRMGDGYCVSFNTKGGAIKALEKDGTKNKAKRIHVMRMEMENFY